MICLGEGNVALHTLGPRKLKKHFVSPVVPETFVLIFSMISNPFVFEDRSWLFRMLSFPPGARLMQTPEEFLRAEAAGASGIQQVSGNPHPREKCQRCSSSMWFAHCWWSRI